MDLLEKAYARAKVARQIPIYPKKKPVEIADDQFHSVETVELTPAPRVWTHRLPGVAPWREEMRDLPVTAPIRVVSIRQIINAVAAEFGVTSEEIRGSYRTRKYVFPRHIAQYLCCRICKLSLPIIGRHFFRDHTSVLSGRRKIERLVGEDASVRELLERLEKELRRDR